jgi:ABC-2 type transport system ATP-binding protein
MYMRLAFSVAINVDADVLLIDEILGVGDASFQAKCFGKLREIKANGTTIVIVSHSLSQIEQICDRSIWISNGVIQAIGTPREVHPQYLDFMGKKEAPAILQTEMVTKDESENAIDTDEATTGSNTKNRWGSGDAKILSVHLLDEWEKPVTKLKAGNKCIIKMEYEVKRPLESEIVGFAFYRNDGTYCYGTNTLIDQLEPITLNPKGSIEICISELTLLPADYTIDVAICSQTGFDYDYWRYSLSFSVYSDIQDVGISRIQHKWLVQ